MSIWILGFIIGFYYFGMGNIRPLDNLLTYYVFIAAWLGGTGITDLHSLLVLLVFVPLVVPLLVLMVVLTLWGK